MRNLKKVLALALVTVMLLGMMAMASAKGYADEDVVDAKYDVAVDVMQAIGVFEGTKVGEDTYLYPTNTLTRAEAAKVITYIAMTKANASKLGTAEAPFADVPADHWAAGSIAYAKQLGIIGGVGNDKYDPNGSLTGYAFAKMLLVVLGYKADNQGYVGSNWSTNVNADALKAGLLKDLSISLADNITREQAAQMAFNALQAKTAYYEGNTSITIGDVVLAVGGSVKLDDTTLANKLYPTLVKQDAADNAFGYNVCDWYLGETKVATAKDYTVLASFAGTAATLTQGAAYNILGAATPSVSYYVNGADTGVVTGVKGETVTKAGLANYAGATVEFVKNSDGSKEAIVKVAYAAKVTKVTEATAKTDRKVDVTIYGAPIASATITTKSYAKDQYILVYLSAANAVIGHEAAQTAYGTLTATAGAAGATTSLYLDGVAVPVAGIGNHGVATADYTATTVMNNKQTVVLYNGYALKVVGDTTKASLSNIVYVNKFGATATDAMGLPLTYKPAEVVHTDGTIEIVKVATGTSAALAGKVVKMTAAADGLKTFASVTGETWNATTAPYVAYDVDAETLTATQKKVAAGAVDAYFTANSTVVTVGTNTAGETVTKVAAAPLAASLEDAFVVYSKNTANTTMDAYEVEVIFNKGTITATATDLYYVVNKDLGQVYVAADKTTYKQVAAYEIATGEKKTVLVALNSTAAGFCAYTVDATSGAYTFSGINYNASANTGKYYDIDATGATDIKLYDGKYMTIGDLSDADVSAALVIDAKGTAVKTVADLMAKDALTGASDKVTFSVVRTPATNKITAIVVTGY